MKYIWYFDFKPSTKGGSLEHYGHSKLRGSHTTLIEYAKEVVEVIIPLQCVQGVSYGYITLGKKASGGKKRLIIGEWAGGVILYVRQRGSFQTLKVYSNEVKTTIDEIKAALKKAGIEVKDKQ